MPILSSWPTDKIRKGKGPHLLSRPIIPNLYAKSPFSAALPRTLNFLYSPLAPFFYQYYKQSYMFLIFTTFPQVPFSYCPISLHSKISQECGFIFITSLSLLLSYLSAVWVLFPNIPSYQTSTRVISLLHIAKYSSYFSVFILFEFSPVKAKTVHHSSWKQFSFSFYDTVCS